MNKAQIIGRLGQDPEIRYTSSGSAVANLRVATNERRKGADGAVQESTEWHSVTLFARQAEVAGEYLKKGSQVYVEGRLRTRKWQGKDGQECYTTEIVGSEFEMLGARPGNGEARPAQPAPARAPAAAPARGEPFYPGEDIPF